jgi:hypothetical protein
MARSFLDRVVAVASKLAQAGFNFGVGVAPTAPVDGDFWNTPTGAAIQTGGATLSVGSRGRVTEVITGTAGQTTFTFAHTPASLADIEPESYNGVGGQDPSNITGLAGKTVTFTALNAGDTLALSYTRID